MRARRIIPLVFLTAAAGVIASGFPRRMGLTRSQAAVSLPGDLLHPNPAVVADYSILIDASSENVWRSLVVTIKTMLGEGGCACCEQDCDCATEQGDSSCCGEECDCEKTCDCGCQDGQESEEENDGVFAESTILHLEAGEEYRDEDSFTKVEIVSLLDSIVLSSGPIEETGETVAFSNVTYAILPEADGRKRLHIRERLYPDNDTDLWAARASLFSGALNYRRIMTTVRALAESLEEE